MEIQTQMKLESIKDVERLGCILDFLGFKTLQSIAKLQNTKERDRFLIESSKLSSNTKFQENFPHVNVNLNLGDILVLNDIAASAASLCMDKYDSCVIRNQVHKRCQQVSLF